MLCFAVYSPCPVAGSASKKEVGSRRRLESVNDLETPTKPAWRQFHIPPTTGVVDVAA